MNAIELEIQEFLSVDEEWKMLKSTVMPCEARVGYAGTKV